MRGTITKLLSAFSTLSNASFEYEQDLNWQKELDAESSARRENCTRSHMTRYTEARRHEPVFFSTSPSDHFEAPSIVPLNSTAGEQWEFDGVSDDGAHAFMFGFSRDPNWAILGSGNLRVSAEFSLLNGSLYSIVEYAEESTVTFCPGYGTHGVWQGGSFVYSFYVSADMSHATVSFENPEGQAKIRMKSVAWPRYADNQLWPSTQATKEAVPHFFWVEPIPVAEVIVDGIIHGAAQKWTGMGGHERLWHAFNWPASLYGMLAVRLHVGPYALSSVEFESSRVGRLRAPSITLYESGKRIFASQQEETSHDGDLVRVRKLYDGTGVASDRVRDRATGMELYLRSKSQKRAWRFIVTHQSVLFDYGFADGNGGTGFSGVASGGEVESQQWEGPAFVEILNLPRNSWLIKSNYRE